MKFGHEVTTCWKGGKCESEEQEFQAARRRRRRRPKAKPQLQKQGWVATGKVLLPTDETTEVEMIPPCTADSDGNHTQPLPTPRIHTVNAFTILQEVDTGQLEENGESTNPT